jgi:hypothetical protein
MYKFTSWVFSSIFVPSLLMYLVLNNIDFYSYNYNILLTYLISAPFHLIYSPYIEFEYYYKQLLYGLVMFIQSPIMMLSKIDYFYLNYTILDCILNIFITYCAVPYVFYMVVYELLE